MNSVWQKSVKSCFRIFVHLESKRNLQVSVGSVLRSKEECIDGLKTNLAYPKDNRFLEYKQRKWIVSETGNCFFKVFLLLLLQWIKIKWRANFLKTSGLLRSNSLFKKASSVRSRSENWIWKSVLKTSNRRFWAFDVCKASFKTSWRRCRQTTLTKKSKAFRFSMWTMMEIKSQSNQIPSLKHIFLTRLLTFPSFWVFSIFVIDPLFVRHIFPQWPLR